MMYHFNVTGQDRKALVGAIENIIHWKAVYKKTPNFEYVVNNFTIDRNGTVSCDDADALERLVHNLIADGFRPEEYAPETTAQTDEPEASTRTDGPEAPTQADEPATVAISMPVAMFDEAALTNLTRLVESKGELMKRAFQAADLPIEIDGEKVTFPWFSVDANPEEIGAYTIFIQKLCEMAIRQKRVNQTKTDITNEKYEFRCFLLRLGLIGDKYKAERKILLRHLTGSAAFKRA